MCNALRVQYTIHHSIFKVHNAAFKGHDEESFAVETRDRTYVFAASTPIGRASWMEAVESALRGSSLIGSGGVRLEKTHKYEPLDNNDIDGTADAADLTEAEKEMHAMSDEDRAQLMQAVKEGTLTMEEALKQIEGLPVQPTDVPSTPASATADNSVSTNNINVHTNVDLSKMKQEFQDSLIAVRTRTSTRRATEKANGNTQQNTVEGLETTSVPTAGGAGGSAPPGPARGADLDVAGVVGGVCNTCGHVAGTGGGANSGTLVELSFVPPRDDTSGAMISIQPADAASMRSDSEERSQNLADCYNNQSGYVPPPQNRNRIARRGDSPRGRDDASKAAESGYGKGVLNSAAAAKPSPYGKGVFSSSNASSGSTPPLPRAAAPGSGMSATLPRGVSLSRAGSGHGGHGWDARGQGGHRTGAGSSGGRDMDAQGGSVAAVAVAAAAELPVGTLPCPKCATHVKQDEGCDQMACWRCGATFSYAAAMAKIRKEPAAAPQRSAHASGIAMPNMYGRRFPKTQTAKVTSNSAAAGHAAASRTGSTSSLLSGSSAGGGDGATPSPRGKKGGAFDRTSSLLNAVQKITPRRNAKPRRPSQSAV